MKKRILLMCALLVSVITLSGAVNRSFRTALEQWNPIGFTQASNGITQAQSGPETTNLTASRAILPNLTANELTGSLRGGEENVITFTTDKKVGEKVELYMEYTGAAPKLSGMTGTPVSMKVIICKLTSQNVTITGDVTDFGCPENQLTALDVSHNTALTELRCYSNQLTALDVSNNTALTKLDCSENQLITLDLSHNTALTELDCNDNQLAALDVSKNTELTSLNCDNNQLTALDVSNNTALGVLYCYDNQLTTLDLPKNTKLNELHCYNNQLTALDLSNNPALRKLWCNNNQLHALDVSQNTALIRLDCNDNQLAALDVSNNTALKGLYCYNNQLAALDLSQNTELELLNCYGNQIKGEKMTRLVNSLPDLSGKKTGSFIVVQERDGEGNRCLKSDVTIAKSKNWKVKKLSSNSSTTSDYEGIANVISFTTNKAIGETVSLLIEYTGSLSISGLSGTPRSGDFVTYKITSPNVTITGDVTKLFCANNQLTVLDLTRNRVLKQLYCGKNQLYTLDLSQNTALTELECLSNKLTTLDLSKNTQLTLLWCAGNPLKALDLSQNSALTSLWCTNNQLTALDLSHNTALETLVCSGNQLTVLDLSPNSALKVLACYGNQIKGGEMTRLVNRLPDRTGKDAGYITVVQEPGSEGNRCLKKHVAIAKGKNWNVQKYNTDNYSNANYEGEEPIPYAVTLTREGEGTLTATGADDLKAVPEGTELTVVATPAEGYELTALTANGADILATKKFTVTANTEVKATFTKIYAVTLTKEGEGTLTATGAADLNAVAYGTELTIVATPAAGYELKALTANGADILATKKVVVKGATEVKATFAKKTATDIVENSTVRLYPNPASTYVNVRATKADVLVRLYNANGSLQYEARTDADGTLQIDLSAYAEGIYLLRVGDDAQRLLIQR